MDENAWIATTSTEWIWFDEEHTLKQIEGVVGDSITIYVENAMDDETDVDGTVTFSINGDTITKNIKRCVPAVVSTDNTITFKVAYDADETTVGPCDSGKSLVKGTTGVSVTDIVLTTVKHYDTGGQVETTATLTESDVNVYYILPDQSSYNTLPKNTEQDRQVSVKVEYKEDLSVYELKQNAFTQRGEKNSNGQYIEDRFHNTGDTVQYNGFDISQDCKDKSSSSCKAGTYTFHATGQKVITRTGLSECNESTTIAQSTNNISDSEVTFSVTPSEYASFNGTNVLSYYENDSRTEPRILNIQAEVDGNVKNTTFTVITGNECGTPLYIVIKFPKEYVESSGETVSFTYYLSETEDGDESSAISDESVIECLRNGFVAPQGTIKWTPTINSGIFTIPVTFNKNDGEEGIKWEFKVNCDYASNNPKTLLVYQASKYENIIPNCDYFIFRYIWEDVDGRDLDSLTHITNVPNLKDNHGSNVSTKTVGFNGTGDYIISQPSAYQVIGQNGKMFLKFGGDNRCNGSEYTIVCLKNILESEQVSNDDIIHIDIYANWWGEKGSRANMNIVYSQYSGISGGGYDEEIEEEEHINECLTSENKSKYYSFKPVEGKCISVSEDVYSNTIHVSAAGKRNPTLTNSYVNCIDGIYTHVLRLVYNVAAKKSSLKYFPDSGIDTETDVPQISINGTEYTLTYDKYESADGGHIKYENVYLKHTIDGQTYNVYIFENDNDVIKCNEYKPTGVNYDYKKSDLGSTKEFSFVHNFIITKNSNKTINIEFDLDEANENKEFDLGIHVNASYLGICNELMFDFGYLQIRQQSI